VQIAPAARTQRAKKTPEESSGAKPAREENQRSAARLEGGAGGCRTGACSMVVAQRVAAMLRDM
jgi:hypothetical protein